MTLKQEMIGIGLLTLGAAAAGLLLWPHLPAMIPTHWDLQGHVNGRLPKGAATALMAGLTLLPGVCLAATRRLAPHKFADESSWATYGYVMLLLSGLFAATWSLMLAVALGQSPDIPRAVTVSVFAFTALMANVLGKARESGVLGKARESGARGQERSAARRLAARVLFAVSLAGGLLALLGVPALPCLLLLVISAFAVQGYGLVMGRRF